MLPVIREKKLRHLAELSPPGVYPVSFVFEDSGGGVVAIDWPVDV